MAHQNGQIDYKNSALWSQAVALLYNWMKISLPQYEIILSLENPFLTHNVERR